VADRLNGNVTLMSGGSSGPGTGILDSALVDEMRLEEIVGAGMITGLPA
jgi:hypothetical protein